jgi:hypothetical protein
MRVSPVFAVVSLLSSLSASQVFAARIVVLEGTGQVLREGEFAKEGQAYPQRTRVRVLDDLGRPIAGTPVLWTVPLFRGRFFDGVVVSETSMQTFTDANGEASNAFVAPYYVGLGNSFQQVTATVSAAGATAPLYFTTVAFQVDGFPNPFPMAQRLSPATEPPSIRGRVGQTLIGAIRYKFTVSSRLQGGMPLTNVGLSATTGNTAQTGPVVECAQAPVVLSDDQGIASCDLKISGRPGTAQIRLTLGGGYTVGNEPFLNLTVDPGEPSRVSVLSGNNQSGDANQWLSQPLFVTVDDGAGNTFAGVTINWSVIQGQATLGSATTVTDFQGRAFTTLRLGAQPGTVLVRATAATPLAPSATFSLQVNAQGLQLARVGGDNQAAASGSPFPLPLQVRLTSAQQLPVAGASVAFQVTSGQATLTSSFATTDASGFAQVSAIAGAIAGAVRITASVPGTAVSTVFSLTNLPSTGTDSRAPRILFRDSWGAIGVYDLTVNQAFNGGGVLATAPSGAQNSAGDTYLVARDADGALWFRRFTAARSWSDWVFLGGQFEGQPAIAVDSSGTALIVARDRFGAYWALRYTPQAPVPAWDFLGGWFASDPAAAAAGSLGYIVGRDVFDGLWMATLSPSAGPAFSWQRLGGIVQGKPAVAIGPGGPVVVARDAWQGVWAYQRVGIAAAWSYLGGVAASDPQVVALGSATPYVTFLDATSMLWYAPLGGAWAASGGLFADYAALHAGGRLAIAGRDLFGGLWYGMPGSTPFSYLGMNGIIVAGPKPASF